MNRTKCDIYSRVCGYIMPVKQWNVGKEAEFRDRKTFQINEKEDLNKKWQNQK